MQLILSTWTIPAEQRQEKPLRRGMCESAAKQTQRRP